MHPQELLKVWSQVRHDLLDTIEKFSDEELSFAPFPGAWQAGQIMLHIADCEDNWIHGVVRGEIKPWIFYGLQDYPTKDSILGQLNAAQTRTTAFLRDLSESQLEDRYAIPDGNTFSLRWILWHVLEHEIHHRGELSLILGMLGHEGLDV